MVQVRAVGLASPSGNPEADSPQSANILGDIDPAWIQFNASGMSGPVRLRLPAPQLESAGRYGVTWQWQFRRNTQDPWIDLIITYHIVYLLLRPPAPAWAQIPYEPSNLQIPWASVLDYACTWAAGAATAEQAAAMITQKVFSLGGGLLSYDCEGGGNSHYTTPGMLDFNATALIARLNGAFGLGPKVNCTDCATIVSTFANALGCDLWQSRMGMVPPYFDLTPIVSIGTDTWELPCGWQGFYFHEVAWSGNCGIQDKIYDACLEINAAQDSPSQPYHPEIPAGTVFGVPGSGQYVDRLASPAGRPKCIAHPQTRIRRAMSSTVPVPNTAVPAELMVDLKRRHQFDSWAGQTNLPYGLFLWRFAFQGAELPGWNPGRLLVQDRQGQKNISGAPMEIQANDLPPRPSPSGPSTVDPPNRCGARPSNRYL